MTHECEKCGHEFASGRFAKRCEDCRPTHTPAAPDSMKKMKKHPTVPVSRLPREKLWPRWPQNLKSLPRNYPLPSWVNQRELAKGYLLGWIKARRLPGEPLVENARRILLAESLEIHGKQKDVAAELGFSTRVICGWTHALKLIGLCRSRCHKKENTG